jgi:DNA-binding MarR family transcriptional regulator
MAKSLRSELKQTKPFLSREQEAHLSIERTAAVLMHRFAESFKPFGVTPTQYNVLRILRGAGSAGLGRNDIRDRLIAQVPDVTRLLDRMQRTGLISRKRDATDRRAVMSRITRKGLDLLKKTDSMVQRLHRRQLGHLSSRQLKALVDLLAIARERP